MTNAIESLSGLNEMTTLLNSKRKSFLVKTHEEKRFMQDFSSMVAPKGYKVFVWSVTSGLYDIDNDSTDMSLANPMKLISHIRTIDSTKNIFVLRDFHDVWKDPSSKRSLRDYLEEDSQFYNPIVFLQPSVDIPYELEKTITLVTFDLPTREEIIHELELIEEVCKKNNFDMPTPKQRESIINALIGMTHTEVVDVLKKTVSRHKFINIDEINKEKEQVIKKTGLLEYITDLIPLSDIGGMDLLKEYVEDASYAFNVDEEDASFIDQARGVVLNGFPGSGKSVLARAIAHELNLPLLKMNLSDIMDSKVGQSEKNIDRALKLAEDVSPAILWIDELEKALSGMSSSDKSDGGTMSRVIQIILSWFADKKAPVFVVATANALGNLPPELTRAGRFDHLFFVSVPSPEEREQIFEIHLKKRTYTIEEDTDRNFTNDQISELAKRTEGFTGAEIEQMISEAGRSAYARYKKDLQDTKYVSYENLLDQVKKTTPLSEREPSLLTELRSWAKRSARFSSSYEYNLTVGEKSKKPQLSLIDFDE